MRIHIRDIRPEGCTLKEDIAPETIGTYEDDTIAVSGPIQITAFVRKDDAAVTVDVTAVGVVASACWRCVRMVERPWRHQFRLAFPLERTTEYIDMLETVREEIILELPTRLVCSDGCKGLCPQCGINLNEGTCTCRGA